jgi:hypothetical protein
MKNENEIDYGILNTVSKELNCNLFGDCSGSTISRRTTKGFKNVFNLDDNDISDQNTEHVVHAAMVGTVACLSSRKEGTTLGGILLLAGLTYLYHNS